MCGIAGLYVKRGRADPQVVRAMTSILVHRGPMDEGYLDRSNVALGMRRLSIIDVDGGHQPVFNEDGTVGVVFNGEIYNYKELREELLQRGHRFTTWSDTEVIVHLYEERGVECLEALNGMFAIALWDDRRQRLWLARDRLGVKPLYFVDGPEHFAFASELKALLTCDFVSRDPDRLAVLDYLVFMYVRAPRTAFAAIRKLLPGHYLTADASGVRVVRYWDLRDHYEPSSISEEEASEQVRALLQDAVRIRLRSDVPVGAFLSGGMDSSTIVACAAGQAPEPLRTFTVDFGQDSFDEVRYARLVAETFRTDHRETAATVDDAIEHLPHLVWHMDEPNADSAIVPAYLVSKFAARELRVALSGTGGDEVFGGYARYFDGFPVEHLYRHMPRSSRTLLGAAVGRLGPAHLARRARWNALPDSGRYLAQVARFTPAEGQTLAGRPARETVDLLEEFAAYPDGDTTNRLLFVDMLTYLPDNILHITDRMSMAVSLEARTPFLDYRLVEFCAGLPGHFKVRWRARARKVVLTKAMNGVLPPAILTRMKWGFGPPLEAWMNRGLAGTVRALFARSEAEAHGFLEPGAVRALLQSAGSRVHDFYTAQKLWSLLVLELWCRIFLSGNGTQAPAVTLADLAGRTVVSS